MLPEQPPQESQTTLDSRANGFLATTGLLLAIASFGAAFILRDGSLLGMPVDPTFADMVKTIALPLAITTRVMGALNFVGVPYSAFKTLKALNTPTDDQEAPADETYIQMGYANTYLFSAVLASVAESTLMAVANPIV